MKWLAFGCLVLAACGGEDEGGDAMAEEVGGACVFTPGQYVISYEVVDSTSSCSDFEPFVDEYLTVSSRGDFGGSVPPDGCVDSPARWDGCFRVYERECVFETTEGTFDATMTVQFWFDQGEGQLTLAARLYFGSTLADACNVNMEATIQER